MLHFSLCLALASAAATVSAPAAANPAVTRIVVLGDSLSAEYGLARGSGWVALLSQRLQGRAEVINASISGDTTSGGRSRLAVLLRENKPKVLIIELGANDALRGLPLKMTAQNLRGMCEAAQAAGTRVLLVGMQMPPNFGPAYTRDFAAMYATVAHDEKTAFVPFLLKGIAEQTDIDAWFQADRIHPLARAHPIILDNVWPVLKPLL